MKVDIDSLEKEIALHSVLSGSEDSFNQIEMTALQVRKAQTPQPGDMSFEQDDEVSPLRKVSIMDKLKLNYTVDRIIAKGTRKIETQNIKVEELLPGQFLSNQRLIRRAETSLFCHFDNRSRIRIKAVILIEKTYFDYFILVCILTNSISMAMFDYQSDSFCQFAHQTQACKGEYQTTWNRTLNTLGYIFSLIFTIEAIIKIFALGFLNGHNTYLKNPWNVLDFIIVIFGVLEFVFEQYTEQHTHLNFRVLRMIRILRPLKAMKTIPSLRKQISALFLSVKGFLNVIVFLMFMFVIFSSIGLQWFSGAIYYACREEIAPYVGDLQWNKTAAGMCTPISNQMFPKVVDYTLCSAESTCGSPLEFGLNPQNDGLTEDIQFGIGSFDTFGQSLIAVFQIITLDNWSVIMFNLMRAQPLPLISFLFCVTIIFLGSFFLINLMLAVMIESYIKSETQYNEEVIEKLKQEQSDLEILKDRMTVKKIEETKVKNKLQMFSKLAIPKVQEKVIEEIKEESKKDENASAVDRLVNNSQLSIDEALDASDKTDGIPEYKSQDCEQSQSEISQASSKKNKPVGPQHTTPSPQKSDKIENRLSKMQLSIFSSISRRVLSQKLQKKVDKLDDKWSQKERSIQMNSIKDQFNSAVKSTNLLRKQTITKELNIKKEILQNQIQSTYTRRIKNQAETTDFGVNNDQQNFVRKSLQQVMHSETKNNLRKTKKLSHQVIMNHLNAQNAEYIASSVVNSGKFDVGKLSNKMNFKHDAVTDNLAQLVLLNMHEKLKSGDFQKTSEEENKKALEAQQNVELVEHTVNVMGTDMVELRASKNTCFMICYKITDSKLFIYFITICIMMNVAFLAFDKHPMPESQELTIEWINIVFCVIFQIEMVLKFIGLGCFGYFSDRSNTLDFFIVVLSSVDVGLFITINYIYIVENNDHNSLGFQVSRVFRISRILRIVKLTNSWQTLNSFVKTISDAATKMTSFIILLLLVNFIYTLMGLELFAQTQRFTYDDKLTKSYFDYNSQTTSQIRSTHDTNFDNFIDASLSVFIIITGDGWMDIYSDHYRASGALKSTLYFVPLIVLGTYIILNLFVTIMLQEFDQNTLKLMPEKASKKKQTSIWQRCIKGKDSDSTNDRSLFLFSSENKCRQFFIEIATSTFFETFILVLIMISSIFLAFESPLNEPEGLVTKILAQMDYATTAIFFMEMFIKIVAFGFAFNGPKSYILDVPNILDFVIVSTSLFEIFLDAQSSVSFFKVLRCARLLRPLRMISKNENLKLSISALLSSMPAALTLLIIVLLVQFVFAVIGINLFKGKSFYCDTDNIIGLTDRQIELTIKTQFDCLNFGGTWSLYQFNYDNISAAMIQTVFMSLNINLPLQMFTMMNSSDDPHIVPGFKEKRHFAVYFVITFLLCTFFMTNMFIAVVIAAFNHELELKGKDFLMTDDQKQLQNAKVLTLQMKPKLVFQSQKLGCFRRIFYKLVTHPAFDLLIMVAITLNTISMALKWPNMSPDIQHNLAVANYVFTAVFLVEAILKLTAFSGSYFRDKWNVFDFIIVLASCAVITLENLVIMNSAFRTTASLMRTLRIGRLFKFFRRLKKLQIIFQTFLNTFYSLVNVGGLMFLLIYIYSVLGVSFFADVKMRGAMHARFNFQNTLNAFATLLVVATGDGWNEIYYTISDNTDCVTNPTYEDYIAAGRTTVGCGNQYLALFYFFSFALLISIIFLNLFIAIILNGYFDTRDQEKKTLNHETMEQFKDAWAQFDPNAKGHIDQDEFQELMIETGHPLGWKKPIPEEEVKLYLKTHGKQFKIEDSHKEGKVIFFHDVLDHVALLFIIKKELIADIQKNAQVANSERPSSSSSDEKSSSNRSAQAVYDSQPSGEQVTANTQSGQIAPENEQPSPYQDNTIYGKMMKRKQAQGKIFI